MELIYSYSKYGVAACSFTLPKRRDNYIRVLTTILPVLLTNVLVTTLVGIKVWYVADRPSMALRQQPMALFRAYRRSIKPALGHTSQTRVEKILFLLVVYLPGHLIHDIDQTFQLLQIRIRNEPKPSPDEPLHGGISILQLYDRIEDWRC